MRAVIWAAAVATAASGALAQDWRQPVPAPTIRYLHGVPTLDLEHDNGGVLVTPLPADHGRLTFGVAVYNHGAVPADFGVEDVGASVGGVAAMVLTKDQLVAKAKHRAFWTQVAVAAISGGAAGIASTAYTNYRYHAVSATPFGPVVTRGVIRDNTPGIVGAAAFSAAGAAGVAAIRDRLTQTIARLGDDVIQRTTVDPDGDYSGRIVLDAAKGASGSEVRLTVRWNGAEYPFLFRTGGTEGAAIPVAAGTPVLDTVPVAVAPGSVSVAYAATAPAPTRPAVTVSSRSPAVADLSEAERYRLALRAAQPF